MREVVLNLVPHRRRSISTGALTPTSTTSARPEDFTDINGDGDCNDGEPFEDVNGNGTWDADRGQSGSGGARDAVLYTVTVTYPRMFPYMKILGFSDTVTARARTVLRNQPYGPQNAARRVGNCA